MTIKLSFGNKANSILSVRGGDRGETVAIVRGFSNQWQLDIHWLTGQSIAPFLLGVVNSCETVALGDDAPIIYNNEHSLADKATNSILFVRGGNRGETAAIGRGCSNHWQLDIHWLTGQPIAPFLLGLWRLRDRRYWAMICQSFTIELLVGDKATNSNLSLGVVTGARQLLLGEDAPTIDNWTFRWSRIINWPCEIYNILNKKPFSPLFASCCSVLCKIVERLILLMGSNDKYFHLLTFPSMLYPLLFKGCSTNGLHPSY